MGKGAGEEMSPSALALALDVEVDDWDDVLSLGEQQRMAFARLLFNGAELALLDEATSALEASAERDLYGLLMAMPGLSVVSVGHRESLEGFHGRVLRLRGEDEVKGGLEPFTIESICLPEKR
ncbi:unnamed protein product [Discosporangium mesarthrocarpum]